MSVWNRFWFRDESPVNLIAARIILALNALWLVLSRPKLTEILTWPRAFWIHADPYTRSRFLIVFPYRVELVLYCLQGRQNGTLAAFGHQVLDQG